MDVDEDDDPVPEITKRHFEEAMKFARRQEKINNLCYVEIIIDLLQVCV